MKASLKGLVLLVLAALLLVPAHAARDLTSEDKDKPMAPQGNKTCLYGTECDDGKCRDLNKDNQNCGSCGTKCPAGAKCIGGTCECAKGLELCEDGTCGLKGKCPTDPVPPPEPECVNNATTLVVPFATLAEYCFNPLFCSQFDSSVLCDPSLELPAFDQLEPDYQALLTTGRCFLNATLDGANEAATGPLAPWCECLFGPDTDAGRQLTALTVLSFLVGTNTTTGEVSPPANFTAPEECADAPFVPFKDTYLCDRRGLPGGSCGPSPNDRCPFDRPIGQYNVTSNEENLLIDVNFQCTFRALALTGAFTEQLERATCLPDAFGGVCQVQSCPCPDPCPTNAWSLTYPVSFWKDSYCPNEDGIQAGACDTTNPNRPAVCDFNPAAPFDFDLANLLGEPCLGSTGSFQSSICQCLMDQDEATANITASSLNAVLNFDFNTSTVIPPEDIMPPTQCSNATFVPARNLYVCNAEGVQQEEPCNCPKSRAFSQWFGLSVPAECFEFVSAAAEGGQCLAPAEPAVNATIGSPVEARCRLSTCPCPEAPPAIPV